MRVNKELGRERALKVVVAGHNDPIEKIYFRQNLRPESTKQSVVSDKFISANN